MPVKAPLMSFGFAGAFSLKAMARRMTLYEFCVSRFCPQRPPLETLRDFRDENPFAIFKSSKYFNSPFNTFDTEGKHEHLEVAYPPIPRIGKEVY